MQFHRLWWQVGQGATCCDVKGASDVDCVVAFVHARCFEVVGHVRQRRVAQQVAQTGRPDPAGAEVLVAIEP